MIGYVTDPFQYPFMQRALVEVLLLLARHVGRQAPLHLSQKQHQRSSR